MLFRTLHGLCALQIKQVTIYIYVFGFPCFWVVIKIESERSWLSQPQAHATASISYIYRLGSQSIPPNEWAFRWIVFLNHAQLRPLPPSPCPLLPQSPCPLLPPSPCPLLPPPPPPQNHHTAPFPRLTGSCTESRVHYMIHLKVLCHGKSVLTERTNLDEMSHGAQPPTEQENETIE